jgi:hypothetical protein
MTAARPFAIVGRGRSGLLRHASAVRSITPMRLLALLKIGAAIF